MFEGINSETDLLRSRERAGNRAGGVLPARHANRNFPKIFIQERSHKIMTKHALPKDIRTAVNRNAFRLAKAAYPVLCRVLTQKASTLLLRPDATPEKVIMMLDSDANTRACCAGLVDSAQSTDQRP